MDGAGSGVNGTEVIEGMRVVDVVLSNATISVDNSTSNSSIEACQAAYDEEFQKHELVMWWVEYILQTIVGVAGLLANTIAIPVLNTKEVTGSMNGIFNRLLIFLAISDNLYIVCSMFTGIKKFNNSQFNEYAFGYFVYQLHNFVLCCSIYLTVALALERYRAVWRPVEYHNNNRGVNPWHKVTISYILPVVLFSLLFNIPKFFEIQFREVIPYEGEPGIYMAAPSALRLNHHYNVWYGNISRLIVQGVIPFACLSFFNYRIYWVMRRRRQLVNRPYNATANANNEKNKKPVGSSAATVLNQVYTANGSSSHPNVSTSLQATSASNSKAGGGSNGKNESAERKASEAQQAAVLFIIVLLFFISYTPRFLINLHELWNLDLLTEMVQSDCDNFPRWIESIASVSHLLMTLNASVNFYIYCFMCHTFRSVLMRWIHTCWSKVCGGVKCCFGWEEGQNPEDDEEFTSDLQPQHNQGANQLKKPDVVLPMASAGNGNGAADQQLSAICLHTHSEHAARPAGLAVSVTIRVDEEAGDAAVVGSDAKVKLLNPGSPVTVTSQVV